jgi:RimJ/RimL family protein N-acetyltransferase
MYHSGDMNAVLHFKALRLGPITLHRIAEDNLTTLWDQLSQHPDAGYMLRELETSYLPKWDAEGRPTKIGFYATLDGVLAGMSLLGISSWRDLRGYTGADTLMHMRGRGVAPGSKPHLFYVGFHLLGLNRIETGCFISNSASRRSIEKTPGFVCEGTLRSYARNADDQFEDELRYAILREDWTRLYDPDRVQCIN